MGGDGGGGGAVELSNGAVDVGDGVLDTGAGVGAVDGNQDGDGDGDGDAGNGEGSSRDQANGVKREDMRGESAERDWVGRRGGRGSLVGVRNVGGRGGEGRGREGM